MNYIARISRSSPPFDSIGWTDVKITADSKEEATAKANESLQVWEVVGEVIAEGESFSFTNQIQADIRLAVFARKLSMNLRPEKRAALEAARDAFIAEIRAKAPTVSVA